MNLGEREAAVIFPAVLEEENSSTGQILQLSAEKVQIDNKAKLLWK